MQSSPELQGFALPTVVDPPDRLCCQIMVPNDPAHIAAFIGVLYDLTLWVSWQRDSAKTGAKAARVWKQIWNNLTFTLDGCDCAMAIAESDYEMSLCEQLRFQNGQLQALCCGEWVNISGQPGQGIGGGGQPGAGTGTPGPGVCQSYQGQVNGSEQWLCPAVVNAGDTVQITAISGAWNDGSANWYCPTGQLFFAGACTASTSLNGADPIPTQPHMCLITKISGSYHNISDGIAFTVPGGVSNALLILQANDSSLSDNSGEITFTVKVCNNQPGTYSHRFDFTTGQHGWSLFTGDPDWPLGLGQWTPGVGWTPTIDVRSGGVEHRNGIYIQAPAGSVTPTLVSVEYALTAGQIIGPTDTTLELQSGASGIAALTPVADTSAALYPFASPGVLSPPVIYFVCARANGVDPSPTGSETVFAITVAGSGPDPYSAY